MLSNEESGANADLMPPMNKTTLNSKTAMATFVAILFIVAPEFETVV